MVDWLSQLKDEGFVVLQRVIPAEWMVTLAHAYTAAVSDATEPDKRIGRTCTRVSDFVNRGPEFDDLYLLSPLLDACRRVIGQSFKLSSFSARTVHAGASAQELHVDVERGSADWPLLGFILMIDEFRPENGSTRFVPWSHRESSSLTNSVAPQLACGPPGSLIMYNGSILHGYSANTTDQPRRSLRGAFIPREGSAGTDFSARMQPQTRERLGELARELLCV